MSALWKYVAFPQHAREFFFLHNLKYSKGGSAADRVTGIGVAVHELLAFVVIVIEGIVNLSVVQTIAIGR